jgi:hypothetical protein
VPGVTPSARGTDGVLLDERGGRIGTVPEPRLSPVVSFFMERSSLRRLCGDVSTNNLRAVLAQVVERR